MTFRYAQFCNNEEPRGEGDRIGSMNARVAVLCVPQNHKQGYSVSESRNAGFNRSMFATNFSRWFEGLRIILSRLQPGLDQKHASHSLNHLGPIPTAPGRPRSLSLRRGLKTCQPRAERSAALGHPDQNAPSPVRAVQAAVFQHQRSRDADHLHQSSSVGPPAILAMILFL